MQSQKPSLPYFLTTINAMLDIFLCNKVPTIKQKIDNLFVFKLFGNLI